MLTSTLLPGAASPVLPAEALSTKPVRVPVATLAVVAVRAVARPLPVVVATRLVLGIGGAHATKDLELLDQGVPYFARILHRERRLDFRLDPFLFADRRRRSTVTTGQRLVDRIVGRGHRLGK